MKKKLFCVILSVLFILPFSVLGASASSSYTIVSPYADVVWSGQGAWGAYKGNLHTHSFVSDAEVDFRDMILEYYNQGYDFLAMTDHAVTGKAWNEKQTALPLYYYQNIIGNWTHNLTDEEFNQVTSGTYPVNSQARGRGMTCVTGGNELNGLTLTKSHVNAIFLPENVGNNHLGYENDYEGAVRLADKAGALSFINHPGDWIGSSKDRSLSSDPEYVDYFADILLRYDSCLGMEVFNERNSVTPYDRVLWDSLLMKCLPYGKTVIGFSNGDTHYIRDVDSSFCTFMMKENTVENIKKTMQTGASFLTTRILRHDDILGPKEDMDMRNSGEPYPMFTEVSVSGHKVTVKANQYSNIQWVADGKVIATKDIAQSADTSTYVLDLDTVTGAKDFSYIRCQLIGKGGITLTQALIIDDGTKPLTYEQDNSTQAQVNRIIRAIKSARVVVITQTLIGLIGKLFK